MTHNQIVRRLRYILNYSDAEMIQLFALAGYDVDMQEMQDILRKNDDPEILELNDKMLAVFLNGLIIHFRGPQEGGIPEPEEKLDNNAILRKIKIALQLKSDDMLEMYRLAGKPISPHELSSFFRNPSQKQYRLCNNQYLRHFLLGLQLMKQKKPVEGEQNSDLH